MFDIGGGLQELILIFGIALLVFGPKNLPQLARALGRAMREFKRAQAEFRAAIETNLHINEIDSLPEPPAVYTHTTTSAAPASEELPEPVLNPLDAPTTPIPEGEPYLARHGAKLFHGRDCGWARRIPDADRVYFKRIADAKEAGLSGCPACEPVELP
jgi:sec-independent protein translocase protein TatB